MSKVLSDPYRELDRLACGRFISYVDNRDYLTFKAFFPRRGVMQSFINSIIKEVTDHARTNSGYSYADPDNEHQLVELIERVKCIIWATGREKRPNVSGSTNPPLNRNAASRIIEGTTSTICEQPESTQNNSTEFSGKAKQRKRLSKRKTQKDEVRQQA